MKSLKFVLILILIGGNILFGQNPIIIPDTVSGPEYNLLLQSGEIQYYSGQKTITMGVNGDILGPTLLMDKDDQISLVVENQLGEPTTIHWHGMHVSASNDGGPHTVIEASAIWNPQFTVLDEAGTYWYHPHLHEKTNEHVSKGLAGFIIVRDDDEASLELPRTYGVDDFPLAIQTKDFDENNQIVVPSNADDILMVNATIDPVLDVPAQVVRFRVLNGSSQRVFNIGFSDDHTFYQIASDGGLLSESISLTRLQLAPGERAELLFNFSGMDGQSIKLMSYASEFQNGIYGATYPGMMSMMTLNNYNPNPLNGNDYEIMTLNVVSTTGNPVTTIPTTLVEVNPIPESWANITRNIVFTPSQMGSSQLNYPFLINGTGFDMNVINYSIPLNNIEIWDITNQSAIAHPFHIHDVQFFVLDRNGSTLPPGEQGYKDVILIEPLETVRFITQFTDFANDTVPYMFHCHMLVHEDDGMMGQFEVVDNTLGVDIYSGLEENVILYPNPINDGLLRIVFIDGERMVESYEIISVSGRLIVYQPLGMSTNNLVIYLSTIVDGQYWIRINSNDKFITKKFIKN
ncbi:MAG: multicopper oxidase domain-containing protein [Bacteroidota bacterium]